MISVWSSKNVLFLYLLFLATFFAQATPRIVILMGPSNTGKSLLCEKLSQYKGWHKVEKDVFHYQEFPKFLARVFPKSCPKVRKVIEEKYLLHAVLKKQCCFKDNATDHEKKEALIAIDGMRFRLDHGKDAKKLSEEFQNHLTKVILDDIDAALSREESVLINVFGIKDFFALLEEKYSDKPVVRVLIHTPIAKSFTLFQKRNQIAQDTKDLREFRFWRTWVGTNDRYYIFSHEKKANYLSFISQHHLKDIFSIIRKEIVEKQGEGTKNIFSSGEMDLSDLEQYKQTWLCCEESGTQIFLYAKEEYDLIAFNNDSPTHLALQVKEYVETRQRASS